MLRVRVIPCLLLSNGGLVKTVKFDNAKYVGDPINAVKIFNEKEVDELLFLDIGATAEGRPPDFGLIEEIASEAFMPFGYGGGVSTADDVEKLIRLGVEKVVLNSAAVENPDLISVASKLVGRQSVLLAMDVKKSVFGRYEVVSRNAKKRSGINPVEWARRAEEAGAGEIILNSVDCDGVMAGYDIKLLKSVTSAVSIPVVAVGGAGSIGDFRAAVVEGGASAVAAGSLFVFYGKHRAVLITYPEYSELEEYLETE